jgi:dCTP deaminase
MILGKQEIQKLIDRFNIVIPYTPKLVGGVHIDLRLGSTIIKYIDPVDLHSPPSTKSYSLTQDGYKLEPGAFVVSSTYEEVYIPPGYWGSIETKGNIARAGLSAHNSDGHIDPGYRGVLTLEIKNQNDVSVTIYPHVPFVQLFLFEVKGDTPLYSGKYQNSKGPTIFIPDSHTR